MNKLILKNFVKFLCFVLLFFVNSQHIAAQSNFVPNVFPPSPEAASLGKFVEVPVSHYTGLPNITVPLYTIESGEIKLPIGVSYHARGIQVSEIASQVGAGWTLLAGGAIIRQIRGRADETPFGYLTENFYSTFFTSLATRQDVYAKSLAGRGDETIDLEPDVYFFNFLNFSGKFIFDQITKKPVIQKFSDFIIDPVYESGYYIKGWVITDKDGIKYYFGTSEDGLRTAIDKPAGVSSYVYSSQSGLQVPTSGAINNNAWQLLDIITPGQKRIKFEYVKDKPVYFVKNFDDGASGNINSNFSKMFMEQFHIKAIYFDKGKVVFTKSSTERQDLVSSFALEKIEVFGNDDVLKFKHIFNYNYTSSEDVNSLQYLRSSEPQAKKRMFLESIVSEGSGASVTIKKHTFIYNSLVLPNRFSTAQDSWGYYNGKDNGIFSSFFEGDNRQVDTIKSEAGMLKRILYPTGGSASFEYEHNKVIPPLFYKDLLVNPSNPTSNTVLSLFKNPDSYSNGVYTKPFTVIGPDASKKFTINSNIIFSGNTASCSTTSNNANCPFDVSVYKINPKTNKGNLYIGKGYILLEPGEYMLEVKPKTAEGRNPNDWENGTFSVTLNWLQSSNENEILFAAGKRIKRIVWDDNKGGITSKTYKYLNSSGKSSGKTFSIPNMYYISSVVNGIPIVNQYGATAGSPLTNFQGNSLGYSFVTEINGESNNNIGKTEYTFTMPEDQGSYYKFPYHAPIDNEWLRGMPLNIKYYSFNLGRYPLVKEITNEYLYGDMLKYQSYMAQMLDDESYLIHRRKFIFPMIIFTKSVSSSGAVTYDSPNSYNTYYSLAGTVDLAGTEEIEYMKDANKYQKSTKYFYNYDSNYQLKSIQAKSSSQETLETKYFYPQDQEMTSEPFVKDLIAKNMIGTPLNTKTFRGETKLSEQKTVYDKSMATSNLLLPGYVLENKGAAALNLTTDKKISYDLYDDNGNLLQYTVEGARPTAIIWGYNKTLPVAKIENIAYKSIAVNLINEIATASSNNGTETQMSVAIDKLYTDQGLTNTMITAYTYNLILGLTSVTDPKKITTFYTYDSFGQLEFVKDAQGNLLSQNQYHYKE